MAAPEPRGEAPPPLGSWTRVYLLVVLCSVLTWVALWLLTETFNLPPPG